jgi:hypothetical protein
VDLSYRRHLDEILSRVPWLLRAFLKVEEGAELGHAWADGGFCRGLSFGGRVMKYRCSWWSENQTLGRHVMGSSACFCFLERSYRAREEKESGRKLVRAAHMCWVNFLFFLC